MTVTNPQSTITYTSITDGVPIVLPFEFGANSEIVVRYGADVVATLNTHYTLTLPATLTPVAGFDVLSGGQINVSRVITTTQPTDVVGQGTLRSNDVEGVFDRITEMVQTVRDQAARALHYPAADIRSSLLATTTLRASKLLGFDSVGEPTMYPQAALPIGLDTLTFLQAGAGATPRSVQSRLRDRVHIRDFGGVGDGVTDNSVAFTNACRVAAEIDISGGSWATSNVTVDPTKLAAGLVSDGTGYVVPAPGADVNTILFTVTKLDGFYFRRVNFVSPVSTNPIVAPIVNRAIYFAAGSDIGVDWEVSDCYIEGGRFGIVTSGQTEGLRIERNWITGTWAEAISGGSTPREAFICDNTCIDGGYATGGPQPSGAIRIGLSQPEDTMENVSIDRNHIVRYCVNAIQSGIDCFSGSGRNVSISFNIIEGCYNGIECKTQEAGGPEETYAGFSINFNTIRLIPVNNASGISIFHAGGSGTPDIIGKTRNFQVQGNHISCAGGKPASSLAIHGIILSGYEDVSLTANTIIDVTRGITLSGTGVEDDTARSITVAGNTIDVVTFVIVHATDATVNLFIHNNPLLKTQGLSSGTACAALALTVGLKRLSIRNNGLIWSVCGWAIEIRDVDTGWITHNAIVGGVNAILSQGSAPENVDIANNYLYTTHDAIPAVSGTVTGVGAGLTDGVRTFTVTSGTGVEPTIFQAEVTGGTVTGAVVILQPGTYSVFPSVPTVTVDEGIVGGATFGLTGAVASHACNLGTGTGLVVRSNTVNVPVGSRTVSGAGTYTLGPNYRNHVTTDPTPTYAASLHDVFVNNAPGVGGVKEYVCVTAGGATAAVFNAVMLVSLVSADQTQATSKSTTVVANGTRGEITMNAANLVADTGVSFTFTNSHIAAGDYVAIQHSSVGALGAYVVQATTPAAGSCTVAVRNTATIDLAEAIVLRYRVIKAPA